MIAVTMRLRELCVIIGNIKISQRGLILRYNLPIEVVFKRWIIKSAQNNICNKKALSGLILRAKVRGT